MTGQEARERELAVEMAARIKEAEAKVAKEYPSLNQPVDFTPRVVPGFVIQAGTADPVNHPPHYKVNGIEVIDVIEAFGLGFRLANVVKYVLRADLKTGLPIEDLKKAQWYLAREISWREGVKR